MAEQYDGTAFSGQQADQPSVLNSWSDEGLTPVDVFKVFWDNEIMEMTREETNR